MSYLIHKEASDDNIEIDVEFESNQLFSYSIWNRYGVLVGQNYGYHTESEAFKAAKDQAASLGYTSFDSNYLELL